MLYFDKEGRALDDYDNETRLSRLNRSELLPYLRQAQLAHRWAVSYDMKHAIVWNFISLSLSFSYLCLLKSNLYTETSYIMLNSQAPIRIVQAETWKVVRRMVIIIIP